MATPLFGLIPTGLPPIITPTATPAPTSYLYTLPQRSFSHIVVFLLPDITLPPDTAAAVYISSPSSPNGFRFLGGIGPGKESAIFRIRSSPSSSSNGNMSAGGDISMDPAPGAEISIGISLEPAASVAAQMAALASSTGSSSTEMVLAKPKPDTLLLAQRIIKNAFNFLASFSGNVGGQGGVEVVPLKAFEEWWRKFEGRVRSDPGFLEREGD